MSQQYFALTPISCCFCHWGSLGLLEKRTSSFDEGLGLIFQHQFYSPSSRSPAFYCCYSRAQICFAFSRQRGLRFYVQCWTRCFSSRFLSSDYPRPCALDPCEFQQEMKPNCAPNPALAALTWDFECSFIYLQDQFSPRENLPVTLCRQS